MGVATACGVVGSFWGGNAYGVSDVSAERLEIETEHFVIHFPATQLRFAERAVGFAEQAHRILGHVLQWEPKEKTHLVVEDEMDEANGWARSTLVNEIHLYAYPPPQTSELAYYDDWIRQLVFHEYTHILHTDNSTSGLHCVLNGVFGKIARNNATAPRWYTEGLAVYFETRTGSRGRLRSTYYKTIMRQAALAGEIPSLGRLSTGSHGWLGGSISYIFGAFFIENLADIYGEDRFARFHHAYGKNWIPYGLNRIALRIWDKTFDELYRDWVTRATIRARAEILALKMQSALTPYRRMTSSYRHLNPRISPSGDFLSYVQDDGIHGQYIVKRELDTGRETRLVLCSGACMHRWSEDGRLLYFSHLTSLDGSIVREQLYVYDVENGTTQKIDGISRLRAFTLDEAYLYWVEQGSENTVLKRRCVNAWDAREEEILYESAEGEQIDSIDAYHGLVVASIFDPHEQQYDLSFFKEKSASPISVKIDARAPSWERQRLMWTASMENYPVFSTDGALYYTSDYSGESNLWQMDLETGIHRRVTHLADGIIQPSIAWDGTVYFVNYTVSGRTISSIESRDLSVYQVMTYEVTENVGSELKRPLFSGDDEDQSLLVRPYRAWHSLWPRSWTPSLVYSSSWDSADVRIGVGVSSSDFLQHHFYTFSAAYLPIRNAFEYRLDYRWRGGLWDVELSHGWTQNRSVYRILPGAYRYFDFQTVMGRIGGRRIWNTRLAMHALSLGYSLNYRLARDPISWRKTDPGDYPLLPSLGWGNGIDGEWTWTNQRQAVRSMVVSDGYRFGVKMRFEAPWLGADSYSFMVRLQGKGTWSLPSEHMPQVMQLSAEGGTTISEDSARQFYRLTTDRGGFSLNQNDVMLYGYAPDTLYGQHYLYARLSWTGVVADFDMAASTFPVGIQRLGIRGFCSWGYAWTKGFDLLDSKYDLGGEWLLDYVLGYRQVVRMKLGYAWGGAPGGGHAVYLMLGL